MGFIDLVSGLLPIAALIGLVALVVVPILYAFRKSRPLISKLMSGHYLTSVLVISLVATLGSLFFSEIAGLAPCRLCWYQRVLMYPLVIVSLAVIIGKIKKSNLIILPMSVIGSLVALYHYVIQMFYPIYSCGPGEVNCALVTFSSMGFVTLPLMSLIAFVMIIEFSILYSKSGKRVSRK